MGNNLPEIGRTINFEGVIVSRQPLPTVPGFRCGPDSICLGFYDDLRQVTISVVTGPELVRDLPSKTAAWRHHTSISKCKIGTTGRATATDVFPHDLDLIRRAALALFGITIPEAPSELFTSGPFAGKGVHLWANLPPEN